MFCMHSSFPIMEKARPKVESHTLITQTHVHGKKKNSREKKKIKSPILQYNKWEPPRSFAFSQGRESPLAQRVVYHQTPQRSPFNSHNLALETEVKEIRRALRGFMNKVHEKDCAARMMRDWRLVALVVDRLFFYIYLATIIVSLVTMFPKS